MSDIEFLYIGWCKGKEDGVTHDKVWTAFKAGDKHYAGWGARGKSIRFKEHISRFALRDLIEKKRKKYDEVDAFQLFAVFPYFKEDVSKFLTFAVLANKVQ